MTKITSGVKNRVVLCGYNMFNAYGMLRSLGEGGIFPTLIINKCSVPFIAKSKYAKNEIFFFDELDEIPKIIKDNIKPEASAPKPIIICCEDAIQSLMDCCYDQFKDDYILSNCAETQGEITRFMDKDVQMDVASRSGVLTPRTWSVAGGSAIPSDMIYPCIVKPELSINGSKSEIKVCYNCAELEKAIADRTYLVQEFIEKDFEVVIHGTSIGHNEYYMPCVNRKIRMYPDENSLSSYCVVEDFSQHPGLDKSVLTRFLQNLQYVGMFSMEMAVKDGKYYLLEINMRNDGKQYFSTAAGANLPLMYINSRIGHAFERPKLTMPIYCMNEYTDIQQIFKHKVSLHRWVKDLARTNCFFILNWRDPKPYVYQLWGKIARYFRKSKI